MYAGSLPEGIVPSGTPERDNDSLYGTPKEEVGPNAQAIHFQGRREKGYGIPDLLLIVLCYLYCNQTCVFIFARNDQSFFFENW